MGEKFYIRFESELPIQQFDIDEPFGYSDASFVIKQEDKRFARDLSFSDGEIKMEFTDFRKHYLEKILYFNDRYGFESKIVLGIVSGLETIEFDFDMVSAETDGLKFFRCNVIQDNKQQILKRNKEVKVNVFSDKDLFGNPIEPLETEKILIKALPSSEYSEWEQKKQAQFNGSNSGQALSPNMFFAFNYTNAVITSGVKETVSYIQGVKTILGDNVAQTRGIRDFKYIIAQDNISKLKFTIKDDKFTFAKSSNLLNYTVRTFYLISTDDNFTYNSKVLIKSQVSPVNYTVNFEVELSLLRGQTLYYWHEVKLNRINIDANITVTSLVGGKVTAEGISTSYNSVTPALRLSDVIRYCIKSISKLNTIMPRFDFGGEYYDQYIFNGNLLRNIENEPFYITLKDIEDILNEPKADYQIQPDDSVSIGMYDDYYKDVEIARFDNTEFDQFLKVYNPRFTLNTAEFSFSSYQSEKEIDERNTKNTVHGELQLNFKNENADNKHEVKFGWIRDAYLIDSTRRKALEVSEDTATQDDDKFFGMDVLPTGNFSAPFKFTETAFLQHSYNPENQRLTIRNDGSFNFVQLGILQNSFVSILQPDPNWGFYSVVEVAPNYLVLIGGGENPRTANDGERYTTFQYSIALSSIYGTNRTNEGFSQIDNIANGQSYSNLRFTTKRTINKYHSRYLATANLYRKEQPIDVTFYKNNPEATTTYEGITIKEGEAFVPTNPILSPILFQNAIFIEPLETFIRLKNNIRASRGFVRAIDNNGHVIKFYPKLIEYLPLGEKLNIREGEEKYEPSIINIVTQDIGIITLNEYTLYALNYEINDQEVSFKDNEGYLLYNPIMWHRVSFNGTLPTSLNQLKEWLLTL